MRTSLGNIPVTVITNDYGADAPAPDDTNVSAQQGWLLLSPRARQVLVTSGHDVATNGARAGAGRGAGHDPRVP